MQAPESKWRDISGPEHLPIYKMSKNAPVASPHSYGVAVDIGTTHIRISLLDMSAGSRISGLSCHNPQAAFGDDVLTRLTAASESSEKAAKIGGLAGNAIADGIIEAARRNSIDLNEIRRILIVGNTAMLSLFAGKNYTTLLAPRYWVRQIDCRTEDMSVWRKSWGLNDDTQIEVVQPLAGFVGSDLLAGVLATHLTDGPAGALLIDFGANSEIALWDGEALWVTSAPGGPAFEGSGISCGMPAEDGAIYAAEQKIPPGPPFSKEGTPQKYSPLERQGKAVEYPHLEKLDNGGFPGFIIKVIGGGEAKGICGSGLVDILSLLVKDGELNSNGRFTRNVGEDGLPIVNGVSPIALKKQDVDLFQRAKSAIGAGIICLLKKAGMHLEDISRTCVCGVFGSYLNVKNAQAIGLLPEIDAEKIELSGNTALAGCEMLLLLKDSGDALEFLRSRARVINMSMAGEYEDLFIDNLYLRPMRMEAPPLY